VVTANKGLDCFNWGYDPLHFGAPEGSYASDAEDGAARIREFRAMAQALKDAGLHVGMDVVYNHMSASGQDAKSVLDRIVPGYYHRRDAEGRVTTSTCCANTATEQRMMAKLMIDTAVRWVRHYGIDAFRFDLMGHQPRAAMARLQRALDAAAGRHVFLLGEGWNFGEVADGARFVQASQLSLSGSGIATFSDRARDAVRGGGPADNDARLVTTQGYVNGLHYDSGDWFNRIDWTYQDNYFATGLPPQQDNGAIWALMRPLLTDARIKPEPGQIAWMRDAFRDLLRIRHSSTMFRLRTANDIHTRLRFANTGSTQEPTVLVGLLDGRGYDGAGFEALAYFVNVDKAAHVIAVAETIGADYVLHPVHRALSAADRRPVDAASFDRDHGRFTIPPRSAVVFVVE